MTPEHIIHTVAEYFHREPQKILSHTRAKKYLYPRWIIIHFFKIRLRMSLKGIGAKLGGFDHTTILNARNKTKNFLASGVQPFTDDIAQISQLLGDMPAVQLNLLSSLPDMKELKELRAQNKILQRRVSELLKTVENLEHAAEMEKRRKYDNIMAISENFTILELAEIHNLPASSIQSFCRKHHLITKGKERDKKNAPVKVVDFTKPKIERPAAVYSNRQF